MNLKCLQIAAYCYLLTSCGGGGSSDPATMDFIDRSGFTVGPISAFGSVIVNGVAYDTTNTTFTIDDQPGQQDNLSVGQIVIINATIDMSGAATADTIVSDPSIQGEIQAIDSINQTFTILNTKIIVTTATLFGSSITPSTLAALEVNDRVEVYGFRNANAEVVATLVLSDSSQELELNGQVSNLDINTTRFDIGNLTIDYTNATLVGFSNPIGNGNLVEVEGRTLDGSGRLLAERIEFETTTDLDGQDSGTEVELKGFVTSFSNAEEFEINGIACTTDTATQIEDGSISDLQLNSRVELEGVVDANGIVVADKIEFETESNLELEAPVESVDAINDTVTVLGIEFRATPQTQFIDEGDMQLRNFSLADVAAGDWIKIKAITDSNGAVLNLFKRKNPEDKLKLSGSISQIEEPSLFVDSTEVLTNSSTELEINGIQFNAGDFFSSVSVGQRLNTEGQSATPGILTAESVDVKD